MTRKAGALAALLLGIAAPALAADPSGAETGGAKTGGAPTGSAVVSTAMAEVLAYGPWQPGPGAPRIVPEPGMLDGIGYAYPDGAWLGHGTVICAALGRNFAASFRLAPGVPDAVWPVRFVITHPMLTRPDGKRASMQTAALILGHGELREGWGFDRPYELVAGAWSMALWHGGDMIAQVTFDVRTDCAPPVS